MSRYIADSPMKSNSATTAAVIGTSLRTSTSTFLPETIDAEKVKADYKHGVLTITLAKKEVAKPRTVNIEVTQ